MLEVLLEMDDEELVAARFALGEERLQNELLAVEMVNSLAA